MFKIISNQLIFFLKNLHFEKLWFLLVGLLFSSFTSWNKMYFHSSLWRGNFQDKCHSCYLSGLICYCNSRCVFRVRFFHAVLYAVRLGFEYAGYFLPHWVLMLRMLVSLGNCVWAKRWIKCEFAKLSCVVIPYDIKVCFVRFLLLNVIFKCR